MTRGNGFETAGARTGGGSGGGLEGGGLEVGGLDEGDEGTAADFGGVLVPTELERWKTRGGAFSTGLGGGLTAAVSSLSERRRIGEPGPVVLGIVTETLVSGVVFFRSRIGAPGIRWQDLSLAAFWGRPWPFLVRVVSGGETTGSAGCWSAECRRLM